MVYEEFLKSAGKHLKTCEVINDSLAALDDSLVENQSSIKLLTLNLYYISGYVIECSIKYGIYVSLGYDRTACVKQLDTETVKFGREIRHHRYDKYEDVFKMLYAGSIVLIDNKSGIAQPVKNLYSNWDATVRYCCDDIPQQFRHSDNKEHVIEFYNYAKQIFSIIRRDLR